MPFLEVLAAAGAAGTFRSSVTALSALGVTALAVSVPVLASASVASSTMPFLVAVASPGRSEESALPLIALVLPCTDRRSAAKAVAVAASCVRSSIPSVPSFLPLSW